MKKQHFFAMLLTFVATMAGLFLMSCSDGGDEPEAGKSAQEIYDWNVARIVAEDGSINLYSDTENESLYYLPASSREEASTFCAHILGLPAWDGKTATANLGELGTITVRPSDTEGTFATVNYNLAKIKPFTMVLAPMSYIERENLGMGRPPFPVPLY